MIHTCTRTPLWHPIFAAQKPIKVNRGTVVTTADGSRRRLAALNNSEGKRITRWLHNTWNAQGDDLRLQDIEYALSHGQFSQKVFKQWRSDYIDYVAKMDDAWRASMAKSGDYVVTGLFKSAALREPLPFDSFSKGVNKWIQERGANNISGYTDQQRKATKFLLNYFTTDVPLTVDEMGRVLRASTGLSGPQGKTLAKYGKGLQAKGFKGKQLAGKMFKREAQMIAARAKAIARNEIINAYEAGNREAYRQVAESGELAPGLVAVKIWDANPACCMKCCPLHGEVRKMDQKFSDGSDSPPDPHLGCDCIEVTAVMKEEDIAEVRKINEVAA